MGSKNKTPIRQRFQFVKVEISENDINPSSGNVEVSIDIDLVKNEFKIINDHIDKVIPNSSFVTGYKGENKDRITSEIYTAPDDHTFCFNLKLNKYKHIVAIDTNTTKIEVKGSEKSHTIGLGIAHILVEENDQTQIIPIKTPFVTTFDCEKPENENWIRLIEKLRRSCKCDDPRKVGIVVDSDLGNIADFNGRLKPLLYDYFLPEEFELIYASDKTKDNILNVMISECHKLSRQFIPNLTQYLKESE